MPIIKAIIFDYGGTLYIGGDFVEGLAGMLDAWSSKYSLAIVSLCTSEPIEQRLGKLQAAGLHDYFQHIELVTADKDAAFERAIEKFGVPYEHVAVVDDRVVRGVAWGNRRGCTTIWISQGRFAHETPDENAGQPTHTIRDLCELVDIL